MNFKESQTIELKSSLSQLDKSLEGICAFLNHEGGRIYFGVSNSGQFLGLDVSDSSLRKISQKIVSKIKPEFVPLIRELNVEGKSIIEVVVPEGIDKPYFLDGIAFVRIGSENRIIPPAELKKMILLYGQKNWDFEICNDGKLEDIDFKKVKWYLKEREKHRNVSSKLNISFEELLTNLKCLRNGKPTNAGILFFGKYHQRFFTNADLRVIKFKGLDVINPTLDSVTCQGSLPEMIGLSEDFVRKNIRLLGTRTSKSFRREDKFEYPIDAVREAIINALIHRNYFTSSDVRVFIFDDRLEVINPGTFPNGITPEKPRHKAVNEILCSLVYDVGLIEKYGSGIKMMNYLSKEWGNKQPYYDLHEVETKIVFESQIKESTYVETMESISGLNSRQKEALRLMKHKGEIFTNKKYREYFNVGRATVNRDLENLLKIGLIDKIGVGKAIKYVSKK